jgi:hypothetical protein
MLGFRAKPLATFAEKRFTTEPDPIGQAGTGLATKTPVP